MPGVLTVTASALASAAQLVTAVILISGPRRLLRWCIRSSFCRLPAALPGVPAGHVNGLDQTWGDSGMAQKPIIAIATAPLAWPPAARTAMPSLPVAALIAATHDVSLSHLQHQPPRPGCCAIGACRAAAGPHRI